MKPVRTPDVTGLFWCIPDDDRSNVTLVRIYETNKGTPMVCPLWNGKVDNIDVTACEPLDDWLEEDADWYGPIEGPEGYRDPRLDFGCPEMIDRDRRRADES